MCVSALMSESQCVRDYRDSQSVLQISHQHDLGYCNQRYNCTTRLLSNVGSGDLLLRFCSFLFSLWGWGWGCWGVGGLPTARSHTNHTFKSSYTHTHILFSHTCPHFCTFLTLSHSLHLLTSLPCCTVARCMFTSECTL